jgi:DNA-directed RNA polymerase subunit RPC12/RpoP
MSVEGYQCQRCWATFRQEQSCDQQKETELKCPTCNSTDVKKVELPESWLDSLRSRMRFG